jgi:UDP:flavonoid glycosyltransferase YjiC (YdhE family)
MKVVIAAAGTGGHINPGIAIANKIKQEQPESQIIFIGTERGLEKDLVPRAGYELKTIDSYGISREISLKNIKRLFKTMLSIISAKKILKDFDYYAKKKNQAVLSLRQEEILEVIQDHGLISFNFLKRRFMKVPDRTLRYDLKRLTIKKLIRKVGSTRGVVYRYG